MEQDSENKLDGNAAAGTLRAIFPFEMTLAEATCAACGTSNPLGAAAAYITRMGMVLRCPGCDNALVRVSSVKGRTLLDMRGLSILQIS